MRDLVFNELLEVVGGAYSASANGLIVTSVDGKNILMTGSQSNTQVIVNGVAQTQTTERVNVSIDSEQVGNVSISVVPGSSVLDSYGSTNSSYSFSYNGGADESYQVRVTDNLTGDALGYIGVNPSGFTFAFPSFG